MGGDATSPADRFAHRTSYASGASLFLPLECVHYQLFLAFNDIEHTKTQVRHPQTNGICERFHKTILQEFYQVAFRRKIYRSIDELQADLDEWITYYNNDRTHQGKTCCGRTPMQTLVDGKEAWHDKITTLTTEFDLTIAGYEPGNCQIRSRLLQIMAEPPTNASRCLDSLFNFGNSIIDI